MARLTMEVNPWFDFSNQNPIYDSRFEINWIEFEICCFLGVTVAISTW